MRVMFDVTDPDQRKHTMTEKKSRPEGLEVKAVLAGDEAFIRTVVRAALQEVLEAEMTRRSVPARASGQPTGWDIGPATTAGR
jgi:proline dehydrogenase